MPLWWQAGTGILIVIAARKIRNGVVCHPKPRVLGLLTLLTIMRYIPEKSIVLWEVTRASGSLWISNGIWNKGAACSQLYLKVM